MHMRFPCRLRGEGASTTATALGYAGAKNLLRVSDAVQLSKPDRIDRWQRVTDAGPVVALVLAHPESPGRRAECEPVARLVKRQRVTVDDIIGVRLRQSLRENVEVLAAVARARDDELAFARDALLVLDLGDKPGRVGLLGMYRDRKAEHRRLDAFDLGEALAFVGGDEDAVVVLHPHPLRRRAALRQAVHVLADRVMRLLGRHVLGAHAFAAQRPVVAAVFGTPDPAGRDSDRHSL